MNRIILTTIGFLCGLAYNSSLYDPAHKIDVKAAVIEAYNIGLNECPPDMHCVVDDIGLVKLTVEDIMGAL